jgi:hypothetical protein
MSMPEDDMTKAALEILPHQVLPIKKQYIHGCQMTEVPIGTLYKVYPVRKPGICKGENGGTFPIMGVYVTRWDDPTDLGGYFPAELFQEEPS